MNIEKLRAYGETLKRFAWTNYQEALARFGNPGDVEIGFNDFIAGDWEFYS